MLALRVLRPDRMELAWLGECLAARELARRGLAILGRRVHVGSIEVDLVARDARELVCAEVKTSRAPDAGRAVRWRPAHRVDRERIERQRAAGRELCRLTTGISSVRSTDEREAQARSRGGTIMDRTRNLGLDWGPTPRSSECPRSFRTP
ncbi:MAG: YraN family protein [Planctomycetes bacterium]|nr:YraN family protein [Planctomycetota bacterium]